MPTEADTITVIIPTFNRRQKLESALKSVLEETRVPIRAHVFDNASADDTPSFLAEASAADPRIRVTRRSENIGSLPNYRRAFGAVETGYFVPLADDDRLMPGFLHAAMEMLKAEPGAGAAVFLGEQRGPSGELMCTYPSDAASMREGFLGIEEHLRQFFRLGHYVWSSILWRRDVLDTIRAPYLHAGRPSDVDFQVAAFSAFPIVQSQQVGAIFNVHGDQESAGYTVRDLPDWARIVRRIDRSVAPFFDAAEFTAIRQAFIDRYSPTWHQLPATPLDQSRAIALAAIAGVRMGDWDLARRIVADAGITETSHTDSMLRVLLLQALQARETSDRLETSAEDAPAPAIEWPDASRPPAPEGGVLARLLMKLRGQRSP
ncbi:glycosyltransferase family 2 protein [Acidiphilium sp.]|uniref:glycosyltransferase family 2 protein n=1 Tax=Acidiphilium sp. TaxID=527 RepID=UPI003CFF223E